MNLFFQTKNIKLYQKSVIQSLLLTHKRNMIDCHCHITAKEFDKVFNFKLLIFHAYFSTGFHQTTAHFYVIIICTLVTLVTDIYRG